MMDEYQSSHFIGFTEFLVKRKDVLPGFYTAAGVLCH